MCCTSIVPYNFAIYILRSVNSKCLVDLDVVCLAWCTSRFFDKVAKLLLALQSAGNTQQRVISHTNNNFLFIMHNKFGFYE